MADHVADDEGHARAGERDDVEPVAADARLGGRGQIAGGDLDGRRAGQPPGQEAALQRQRGGVLPGVAPGVVHADRRTGRELLGQQQIIPLERLRTAADEYGHPEGGAAARSGTAISEWNPWVRTRSPRGGTPHPPDEAGIVQPAEHRLVGGQAPSGRRILRIGVHLAQRHDHLGDAFEDRLVGHPAQGQGADWATVWRPGRFAAVLLHFDQVDAHEIGEPGNHDIRQFLSRPHDIERGSDTGARLVQQRQPLTGEKLLRDVGPAVNTPRTRPAASRTGDMLTAQVVLRGSPGVGADTS